MNVSPVDTPRVYDLIVGSVPGQNIDTTMCLCTIRKPFLWHRNVTEEPVILLVGNLKRKKRSDANLQEPDGDIEMSDAAGMGPVGPSIIQGMCIQQIPNTDAVGSSTSLPPVVSSPTSMLGNNPVHTKELENLGTVLHPNNGDGHNGNVVNDDCSTRSGLRRDYFYPDVNVYPVAPPAEASKKRRKGATRLSCAECRR